MPAQSPYKSDFGVIVLCDPRIKTKNYGSTFIKVLEPMRTTNSLSEVDEFLANHEARIETAVAD